MTSFDLSNLDISAAIKAKGGRYLEAPVSGSKRPAEAGEVNPWICSFFENYIVIIADYYGRWGPIFICRLLYHV